MEVNTYIKYMEVNTYIKQNHVIYSITEVNTYYK